MRCRYPSYAPSSYSALTAPSLGVAACAKWGGPFAVGPGDDDGRFDAPERQFARVAHGEGVQGGFGGEVRAQVGRDATVGAAGADPDEEAALACSAHVGQDDAVETVGADAVGVVFGQELLRGEGLAGSEAHVAGVVDEDVDSVGFLQDFGDAGREGFFADNVQGYGAQGDFFFCGEGFDLLDGGVVGGRVAKAGVDDVTGFGEGFCGHVSEAAGSTGNDDDERHWGGILFVV